MGTPDEKLRQLQKLEEFMRKWAQTPHPTDLTAPIRPEPSRRVRQVWREEDDYLFGAGYRAWLATEGPPR